MASSVSARAATMDHFRSKQSSAYSSALAEPLLPASNLSHSVKKSLADINPAANPIGQAVDINPSNFIYGDLEQGSVTTNELIDQHNVISNVNQKFARTVAQSNTINNHNSLPDDDNDYRTHSLLREATQRLLCFQDQVSAAESTSYRLKSAANYSISNNRDSSDTAMSIITDIARKFTGETMASFMVVFAVCATTANTHSDGSSAASILATSLIGGLAVMVSIFTLGHVSGSHINPAVTFAQTAVNHFPLRMAPVYVLGQVFGGILASIAVELLCSPETPSVILVSPKTSAIKSLIAETLGGFVLLFVASSVYTDSRAIGEFAGMAVGSIIAIDIAVVGPVSGGGVNPARALGPTFAYWTFDKDIWVFVVGPIVGGIVGAFLYRLVRVGESITRYKYSTNNSSRVTSVDPSIHSKQHNFRRFVPPTYSAEDDSTIIS